MFYLGDTVDMTHFVNVTNNITQVVDVETCQWEHSLQRVHIG